MSSDIPNQFLSNNQIDIINKIIQKEISKNYLDIKDDINKKIIDYDNKIINYLNELDIKYNELNEKYSHLFEQISILNLKTEKTEQTENKFSQFQFLLAQHDIRINNLIKDLTDSCFKYDKLFLNNLQVPGEIGDCCKWKNVKEFLMFSIKQFSIFQDYMSKNHMDFKSHKDKLDLISGKLNNQVDNFLKTCFEYTTNKIEELKKNLIFQIELVNSKLPKLSFENSNYAKKLDNEITDLINEREDLKNLQIEFKLLLEKYFDRVLEKEKDIFSEIGEYKNEFLKIKKNFIQITEFIKDVRFKRNINNDDLMNNHINKLVVNLKKINEQILDKKNKKFSNVDSIVKQIITGKKIIKKNDSPNLANEKDKEKKIINNNSPEIKIVNENEIIKNNPKSNSQQNINLKTNTEFNENIHEKKNKEIIIDNFINDKFDFDDIFDKDENNEIGEKYENDNNINKIENTIKNNIKINNNEKEKNFNNNKTISKSKKLISHNIYDISIKNKNNEKLSTNKNLILNNYSNTKINNQEKKNLINNIIKDINIEKKDENKINDNIINNIINENNDINKNNIENNNANDNENNKIVIYNIINEKYENNNKNNNEIKSNRSNHSKNKNSNNMKNLQPKNHNNNKFEIKNNFIITNQSTEIISKDIKKSTEIISKDIKKSTEIISKDIKNQKNIQTQFSFSFHNNLKNNFNSFKITKKDDKSISCDIPYSGRNKYTINQEQTKENIKTKRNKDDLIRKFIEEKTENIILIQNQLINKINDLENKINLIDIMNSGLKKKVNEIEISKEKLYQVEEKLNASNKAIEELNEHYLLTDISNIDNMGINLYLPKFKDKRFPPSKVKSKALKKYLLNKSDEIKENIPLFELRTENAVEHTKKKSSPSKLIIEKFEKKRKNEKLICGIYHTQSMKFLKPLKNSFIKIPQTNFINDEK